ncbi:Cdc7p-Dbf4p kinase complex regulatory subunit [Paraconiothyrium brasiliense]|uniref:Cdc7p-Dbf4p kinase complex regulatory subunit n=1 Tax=Paraconiothyrium brasiliense TaxID=300254 RepID=A0ABR3QQT7_9PLEO
MAAVAVPPSPQVVDVMANRRVPLANLHNATNSPMRATAIGGKRQRSHASEQRDLTYGQPPSKKLMVEDDADARRSGLVRRSAAPPTALTKKLEAAREQKVAPRATRPNTRGPEVNASNLETIRNWQRHYRKLFPQFVFWFESVPDDTKSKVSRQAQILGSREAKFFSREVTHVITARPIGPEFDSSSSSTAAKGTVNPAQLESKRSVFDNALEIQKTGGGDILHKAKDLGMKIWALDKLQRMLDTMFNTATGEDVTQYIARNGATALQPTARRDLQKLLEQEKLSRPTDRDYTVAAQDMIPLRGFYIYIHDMDELTRPVMVREYSKVQKKEDGKWPQFRVSGNYKCPFIEDREAVRRQQMEEQDARHARRMANAAPRTRAVTAALDEKRALGDNPNLARRSNTTTAVPIKEENTGSTGVPKALQTTRDGIPPMFGSAQASLRTMPRFIGGEPVASGLHQSNITSAIQSQMISSTAAAPGARAGNSKEVNQLKRKVLERNSAPSVNSGHSSTMGDASLRAALNQDQSQPTRAAKRKAQETLGQVREDTDEERKARKAMALRRKKPVEKELKPGYCENCREKFNDFDEHVVSRKHRKFAVTADNWMELDQLLAQLTRE